MEELNNMYSAYGGNPITLTTDDILESENNIPVLNIDLLNISDKLPIVLSIYNGETGDNEQVQVNSVSNNVLNVDRGVGGSKPRVWAKHSYIGRVFTHIDYNNFKENILNNRKNLLKVKEDLLVQGEDFSVNINNLLETSASKDLLNSQVNNVQGQINTNKSGIATNKSGVATNKSGVATNKSGISTNKSTINSHLSGHIVANGVLQRNLNAEKLNGLTSGNFVKNLSNSKVNVTSGAVNVINGGQTLAVKSNGVFVNNQQVVTKNLLGSSVIKRIQRGLTTISHNSDSVPTNVDVTITSVNAAKSFVSLGGTLTKHYSSTNNFQGTARLIASNKIRLSTCGTSYPREIAWEVIEYV
ncbi:MAG: hypothetical protein ACK5LV_04420 [Lachnospirales bacterium]